MDSFPLLDVAIPTWTWRWLTNPGAQGTQHPVNSANTDVIPTNHSLLAASFHAGWSMRSWESVAADVEAVHGFPGSHGPGMMVAQKA